MCVFVESEEMITGWSTEHSNIRYGLEYEVRPQDDPRANGQTITLVEFFCCREARAAAKQKIEWHRKYVDERERCAAIAEEWQDTLITDEDGHFGYIDVAEMIRTGVKRIA